MQEPKLQFDVNTGKWSWEGKPLEWSELPTGVRAAVARVIHGHIHGTPTPTLSPATAAENVPEGPPGSIGR